MDYISTDFCVDSSSRFPVIFINRQTDRHNVRDAAGHATHGSATADVGNKNIFLQR